MAQRDHTYSNPLYAPGMAQWWPKIDDTPMAFVGKNPLVNVDDDVRNVLRPQKDGSKEDLYNAELYNAFIKAGYTDKKSLRTLTKAKLNELGIKKIFQQKELLKRIASL
eukprot:75094_1